MVSFPPVSPARPYTPPSPHPYAPHVYLCNSSVKQNTILPVLWRPFVSCMGAAVCVVYECRSLCRVCVPQFVSCMGAAVSEEHTAVVFKVTWIIVLQDEDWHRNIFAHTLDISFLIRNILQYVLSFPLILFPFKSQLFCVTKNVTAVIGHFEQNSKILLSYLELRNARNTFQRRSLPSLGELV